MESGLFGSDEVDSFDEPLDGFFAGTLEHHVWLVIEDSGGDVIGAAYYAPEPFSDRVWNLYFIAVKPGNQGDGAGGALIGYVEQELREMGESFARVLIVETSGTLDFAPTRRFYQTHGFDKEARIREFYGPGDDKVVFWKSMVESSE